MLLPAFKVSSGDSGVSLYWLSFACIFTIVRGYNLNTDNLRIFEDPKMGNWRASYFGFSTALYVKSDKNGRRQASVLVGAPRANVSAFPSVIEPGTVYHCEINDNKDNNCIEWNLDRIGNGQFVSVSRHTINQNKNNAWTGGSIGVDYSTINPRVVVCAPNYKETTNWENWAMPGMCYWSRGGDGKIFEKPAFEKVIPFAVVNNIRNCSDVGRGLSQAGFSMQLYSERNQSLILLGGPGFSDARGCPALIKGSANPALTKAVIPLCIAAQNLTKKYERLGYSVTSGFYHSDGIRWYAVSSGKNQSTLSGKVVIFLFSEEKYELIVPENYELLGTQPGEYFGASLASCDVNNDKKDEIIVGAPFWSNEIDEGRIYVFTENHRKFTGVSIDGKKSGARFGSVVTCLGDLDKDGYKDIAVGAPYEGNHGAIYISYGGKEGLNEGFSKRIYGKDISEAIRGFGAAISEPRDVDGNNYDDIAVGAYSSGHVVLLYSRPVVTITVQFSDNTTKFLKRDTTSFKVIVCFNLRGFHIPEKLNVETTLTVDSRRAFYPRSRNENGVYKQKFWAATNTLNCTPYNMEVVNPNIKNTIEIGVSLDLVSLPTDKFCTTCPVVNERKSKSNDTMALTLMSNCGLNNGCRSILVIHAIEAVGGLENGNRYTLGSKTFVFLRVEIRNTAETAFNAKLHFFIPSPIILKQLLRECQSSKNNGISEVNCTLGNRIEKFGKVEITLALDMSAVHSDTERLVLFANVSTENRNVAEPTSEFTIYFDVDVNMEITGKSEPDVHSFVNTDEMEEQKSMRSEHIYTVQKFGKSPMEESNVTIWVPTHLRENNIEVARIIEIYASVDDRLIDCQITSQDQVVLDNNGLPIQSMSLFSDSLIAVQEPTAKNSKLYVPPANRTFYLNCTNQAVECVQISCKLNKFADSSTLAKIKITFDVQLKNLIPKIMKSKDIIYLVSNASVSGLTRSGGVYRRIEKNFNSTSIGTTFVGLPHVLPVATWIIVVSILLGVLLLVLLILGLIKLGFFNRRKREELEALKAKSDNDPGFVLETSSSREPIDAI